MVLLPVFLGCHLHSSAGGGQLTGGFPGGNHSSPAPWAPTGTPSPQDPHSQHGCLSAGHCWAALPGSGSPGAGAHWGRSAEGKNHKQQRQSGTKPARSVRNSREREPPQYQPRPYLQAHQSSHCLEKELQLFKTATGTRGRARPEKPHRERVPVGTPSCPDPSAPPAPGHLLMEGRTCHTCLLAPVGIWNVWIWTQGPVQV